MKDKPRKHEKQSDDSEKEKKIRKEWEDNRPVNYKKVKFTKTIIS